MRVTARFTNAGIVAGRFGDIRQRISHAVTIAPGQAATATVPAYKRVAPVDTGRLRAQIHADRAEVISDVASVRDGFHYTGVTRFGHAYADPDRIFPRGRALGPMLGGRFFSSVRRYHPAADWARRGDSEAQRLAGDRFEGLIDDAIR